MKTKKKYVLTLVALLLGVYTTQAQVKIGSNATVPSTNINLEVEGSIGGNVSKVTVTKDSSKVGIGTVTPTAKLELNSGTTDQSGLRFTQLKSGSADQTGMLANLTVDQNGYVGKSAVPSYKALAVTNPAGGTSINNNLSTGFPTSLTTVFSTDNTTYSISGGNVTILKTGIYKITQGVYMTSNGEVITYALDLYKNGAQFERLAADSTPAMVTLVTLNGTTVLSLNAGDVITWRATGGTISPIQWYNGRMIIERMQ